MRRSRANSGGNGRFGDRKESMKRRAPLWMGFENDMPTMFVHNAMHHGQSHAGALPDGFGGVERFKYSVTVLFGNAWAIVMDCNDNVVVGCFAVTGCANSMCMLMVASYRNCNIAHFV